MPGLAFVSLASIVLRSDIFVFYIAPTTGFLRCSSTFLPRNYRCSPVFLVLFSVRMRWVLMNCVLGLWLTMPRPCFTAVSLHFLQTHTRTQTHSKFLLVHACMFSFRGARKSTSLGPKPLLQRFFFVFHHVPKHLAFEPWTIARFDFLNLCDKNANTPLA